MADGTITKIDDNLNVQWSKTIGGSSSDYFIDVKTDIEGNINIAGTSSSTEIAGLDRFVIKLDENLEIEMATSYSGTNKDVFYFMELSPDGGVAFAGYARSFDSNTMYGYLLKTDNGYNTALTITIATEFHDIISNHPKQRINLILKRQQNKLVRCFFLFYLSSRKKYS